MMPDGTTLSEDALSVFVNLVSKSIENGAGLSAKVDNIAKTQERQDAKLDGLLVTLAEVKQINNNLGQRIDNTERESRDHENRLRVLEVSATVGNDYRRRLESLEKTDEAREKDINVINNKLTRYIAIATTGLLLAQFVIATFIVPWVQQILYGG